MAPQWSQLALNMNILNCEVPKTKLFNTSALPTVDSAQSGALYYRYPTTAVFDQIAEFDLALPVLFNTQVPHQVCNMTDEKRMSISFRFYQDPTI